MPGRKRRSKWCRYLNTSPPKTGMSTIVLQSCPPQERSGWLKTCMDSVQHWALSQGYEWRYLDDALFQPLPADVQPGGRISPVIASDLARLLWLQQLLQQGYERVVWLDADVLVFTPQAMVLPDASYAVGRELWVQADKSGPWRAWKKVHNAAMLFANQADGHNSLLDFYADTAMRLLRANQQGMPAQFIGPKLLSALHNTSQLPVWECVGMLSPAVVEDLLGANNGALACMQTRQEQPLAAANLCRSSVAEGALSNEQMQRLCQRLLEQPLA